jgi:metal-responsive CopG/Arc/MetJ family transcriptional regulator
MGATSRFTVSVPTRLLEAVDRKLVNRDETRSAVVRRLLEEAVREVDEQEDVQRWIRSYRENPQTEEELGWADEAARQLLAEVPWEDEAR